MYLLIIFYVLICILLVLVVLLQSGKGGGLTAGLTSSATQQVFGGRGAGSFLEKFTMFLALLFLVTSGVIGYFKGQTSSSEFSKRAEQENKRRKEALKKNKDAIKAEKDKSEQNTKKEENNSTDANKMDLPVPNLIGNLPTTNGSGIASPAPGSVNPPILDLSSVKKLPTPFSTAPTKPPADSSNKK